MTEPGAAADADAEARMGEESHEHGDGRDQTATAPATASGSRSGSLLAPLPRASSLAPAAAAATAAAAAAAVGVGAAEEEAAAATAPPGGGRRSGTSAITATAPRVSPAATGLLLHVGKGGTQAHTPGIVFLEGHCFDDLCGDSLSFSSSSARQQRRQQQQQLGSLAASGGLSARRSPRQHQARDIMVKVGPPATTKAASTKVGIVGGGGTAPIQPDLGTGDGLATSDQLSRPRTFDPAPFFPGRTPPGRRHQWANGSGGVSGGGGGGGGGGIIPGARAWGSAFNESPLGSALARSRRLEKELEDLREAYARKLAHTELQCEMRMKEKDDEMQAWFRNQRIDISKMKGGVVIMQALWRRLFKRHNDSRREEQKHFEHTRAHLESENERLDMAHREAVETGARRLQEQEAHYEERLAELEAQRAALEETLRKTQDELKEEKTSNAKLQEANQQLRVENYNLNKKLADDEKAGELIRKQAMIESLELELQRTREMLEKKAKGEAEALRKELMDYVRFIVHILPDEIRATVGPLSDNRDTLPEGLREKLLAKIAKDRRRSPPRSPPPWQDVSALPPLASKPSSPVRSFRSR